MEFIKDYIKDKVVYDIGAGEGKFAVAMKKYAKEVVAIEADPVLFAECQSRGVESIYSNFLDVDFEEADVLYIFMNFLGNYALTKKLQEDDWAGIVISQYYPLQNNVTDMIPPDKVIDVNLPSGKFPFLVYHV